MRSPITTVLLCLAGAACDPAGQRGLARPCELEGRADHAIDAGLGFIAAAWTGDGFEDEYLRFRYPGEELDCPLPECVLTYRLLDAYFNLVMLLSIRPDLGPAGTLGERADQTLRSLLPAWRARGLYNVLRDPDPDGIALDTYAILAWLYRDVAMAGVVERHRTGWGWMADDFYAPAERFRKVADEAWAVRLHSATADGPCQVKLIGAIVAGAREVIESPAPLEARVNAALHAVYVLQDGRTPFEAELEDLERFLRASVGEPELAGDVLSLANVLDALALDASRAADDLADLVAMLLGHQQPDGSWPPRAGATGSRLRVFATLRSTLGLVRWRQLSCTHI